MTGVGKREFAREFSQLSCPGQTRMRVHESREATVCMSIFSTVMSWLKPSFHMVVNVSRLCRKCRRDRVRVYLDDTCDTVATRSRPYGN